MSVLRRAIKRRLSNLYTGEISFVDAPANERDFIVTKRRKPMHSPAEKEVLQRLKSLSPETEARLSAFEAKGRVRKMAADGSDKSLTPGAMAALKAVGRLLAPYADEVTDGDMLALMVELGMVPPDAVDAETSAEAEALAADATDTPEGEAASQDNAETAGDAEVAADEAQPTEGEAQSLDMAKPQAVAQEDHDKAMQVATAVYNEKLKAGASAEDARAAASDAYLTALHEAGYTVEKRAQAKEDSMTSSAKVTKNAAPALDAGQRAYINQLIEARFCELAAQNKDLVEKNAKLHSDVAVEREDRLNREYANKAAEFANLGEQGEVAALLKSAHGNEAETNRLMKVLKAANAQADQAARHGSLFTEYGSKLGGGAPTAESEISSLVNEIVEKSANGKQLTKQQAFAKALQTERGRDIYNKTMTKKG